MSTTTTWPRWRAAITVLVLAVAPYVTLKLAWLAGAEWGVLTPGLMRQPAFVVGNLLTLLADVTLIGVVLALGRPGPADRPRGSRPTPGDLAYPPAVLGLGLLLPVALVAPVVGLLDLLGVVAGSTDTGLAGWVFVVVYTGFFVQFVVLVAAVRRHVVHRPRAARPAPRRAQRVLAGLALAWFTVVVVVMDVDPTAGAAQRGLVSVLWLCAVVGVFGRRLRPPLPVVAATAVAAWSAYLLLVSAAVADGPGYDRLEISGWVAGIVTGLAATVRLRHSATVRLRRSGPS